MSSDPEAAGKARRPRLGKIGIPLGYFLIGAALAAVVTTFAYLGGWFTPNELTPARFADALEQVDGVHPGFRRNHAKGLGVSGFFEGNGQGVRLSKAAVFRPARLAVIGRFSLSGGQPHAADMPATVRGLALEFSLPDGELWRTAMINLPVFPVRTPEAFHERLMASIPDPKTGKPDPARMKAFLARHPEAERAMEVIRGQAVSSGFGNTTFYGLNAFRLVNSAGDSVPVRWLMTPEQSFAAVGAPSDARGKDYLFDELIAQIRRQPLRWHLVAIIGQPGDPTDDATIAWPEGREKVDVGTLTLDRAEGDAAGVAADTNFDPLVLPAGIAPSDDPLLSARSAIYSRSFTRRAGEPRPPGAITPAVARRGE
jgi:catalase